MFLQSNPRFPKNPVFLGHQVKNGKKLRLSELVFAETAAIGAKNSAGGFHRHPRKRQESDLDHRPSYLNRKHLPLLTAC
jgi:hypothetical protein